MTEFEEGLSLLKIPKIFTYLRLVEEDEKAIN
jgi:hypothetical protein